MTNVKKRAYDISQLNTDLFFLHHVLVQFKIHIIREVILQYPVENNQQQECQKNNQHTTVDNAQPMNFQ